MNIKIEEAEVTWTSPDKTKVLSKVTTPTGIVYKTFSKTIAVKGWEGEVETYEKDGDTFIKQPYSPGGRGGTKEFKADPVKLGQDKALTIATNLSIQRQVAAKGAVELIVAGKREYADLELTFHDILSLLNPKLGGKDENDQSGTPEANL